MSAEPNDFSLGVEEEFQLVDAATGALRPHVERVLPEARRALAEEEVQAELLRGQIETGTPVCTTLADVRTELVRLRGELHTAAAAEGCRIAATATHPWATWRDQDITPKGRYERMGDSFKQLARDQLVCGCHVHVGIGDRELAIAVLNRSRPWLAPLLALSANSPFWDGADTGYASYRTQVWSRWPSAGPPPEFVDRGEYDSVVEALLATGVLHDRGMVYWDVRASSRFETLEFRVPDVCLSVDEAVLVAGLVRALARTAADEAKAAVPLAHTRPELLRAAHWQAARFGLGGDLIDPRSGTPAPAEEVVEALVEHVRPSLDAHGDTDEVGRLLAQVLRGGTGADRQRAAYARRDRLEDAVELVVAETVAGTGVE